MGVATLITVMTLVQGANLYVEQKIANLGTNVFRIASAAVRGRRFHASWSKRSATRTSISTTCSAVARGLPALPVCGRFGFEHRSRALQGPRSAGRDALRPHAQHGATSTRAPLEQGRYFTPTRRSACGARLPDRRSTSLSEFFPDSIRWDASIRAGSHGIHGHRDVSRKSARCWARIRTTSSIVPAEHVSEIPRLAQQPDVGDQGRGRPAESSSARRTKRA